MFTSGLIGRRQLLLGGIGAAALAVSGQASFSAPLEEIKKRGVMHVVTEDDFYPYEFIKGGEPAGFDRDAIDELRKYAPFKVEQEVLPWTGLLAAVTAGKYDAAITGAGVTEERLGSFNYVAPISLDISYYIKRAGDDRIKGIRDLSGLKLGVQAGGAQLARLNQLEAKLKASGGTLGQIVQYQSYPEAYADLANGRLDFVINSVVNASVLVRERPKVFALGEATTGKGFVAWPIAKERDDILQYLTIFRKHLRETGKLKELQEKWFGMSFDDLPEEPVTSVEQLRKLSAG